jgi:hypothetical protein
LVKLGRVDETVLQGERHLQRSGRRRTLARSSVLVVISYATMLHSVHNEKEGKGSNKNHQLRWMRFADRLQREFLLVSALSGIVFGSGTWC